MIKLIKLEWKKYSLWKYVRGAAITTAVMLGMLLLISSDPDTGVLVPQVGKSTIHALTELFLNMSYQVFTGVMLAGFVVSEYETGRIRLMFSYPIRRWKIIAAKIAAVCLFTFLALLGSKILVYGILLALRSEEDTGIHLGEVSLWTGAVLGAGVSVLGGCIPLFVGMKTKSSRAMLIAAFVIMLGVMGLTQGNVLPFTEGGSAVGYALQILGAPAAFFAAVYRIETEDVR